MIQIRIGSEYDSRQDPNPYTDYESGSWFFFKLLKIELAQTKFLLNTEEHKSIWRYRYLYILIGVFWYKFFLTFQPLYANKNEKLSISDWARIRIQI